MAFAHTSPTASQYPPSKVTICHHTHSKKNPFVTINVSVHAQPAHLRHGDTIGPCQQNVPVSIGPVTKQKVHKAHKAHKVHSAKVRLHGHTKAVKTKKPKKPKKAKSNRGQHNSSVQPTAPITVQVKSHGQGKGHAKGHQKTHGSSQGQAKGHQKTHGSSQSHSQGHGQGNGGAQGHGQGSGGTHGGNPGGGKGSGH